MRIVTLEDDESFWELMEEAVKAEYGRETKTEWLRSESEFVVKLDEYITNPPDVFLLDVMVKWADAAEPMPEPPDDVRMGMYHRAGVRCRNRLLQHPTTAKIPVIFYTVLDRSDIDRVIND